MTIDRETVIQLAHEAGFTASTAVPKLEHFAALVLERNKWMKQINEDEALMRDTLEALSAHSIFKNDACAVAAEALRQRLEAKK